VSHQCWVLHPFLLCLFGDIFPMATLYNNSSSHYGGMTCVHHHSHLLSVEKEACKLFCSGCYGTAILISASHLM
jgi:hypothetical protein